MTDDEDAGTKAPPVAGVVPTDFAALEARRRSRPRPAPGSATPPTSGGHDWELTVDAGGRLDILEPPALEVAAVAALGSVLGGVAFVSFGLDVRLPVPEGSDPDDQRAPSPQAHRASVEPLERAQAELHRRLNEQLGLELRGSLHFTTGGVRREQHGELVRRGRSGTTVLLGQGDDGLTEVLDLSTWPMMAGESLWAAYGVILHLHTEFPTLRVPTSPPAGFTGPYCVVPVVDEEYWARVGQALQVAAAEVGLPSWPLLRARLQDPAARSAQGKNWQLPV